MSKVNLPTETEIEVFQQSDTYLTHCRRWGRVHGEDVIVMLNGDVSHSRWQAPLAAAIRELAPDLAFLAPDRRGSGLNKHTRGHLPSKEREIEDVLALLRELADRYRRIHLAGWCFGAQVACIAAAELRPEGTVASVLMVSPGFVFRERHADVLTISMAAVREAVAELDIAPDPLHAFVPVPIRPTDFTLDEAWLRFIAEDELTLRWVTQSAVCVWSELAKWSWEVFPQLQGLPTIAVFGTEDRLVDHEAVATMLSERLTVMPPVLEFIVAPHAVQFAEPKRLAGHLVEFVQRL